MNVLDIVLLCLLALTGLIGFFKGFLNTLLSFVGSTLSFVASFFLAKPLAGLLNNWFNLNATIGNSISNQISGFFQFAEGVTSATGSTILDNYCSANGFLKMAFKLLVNPDTVYTQEEIVKSIGTASGNLILMAICLIVAFIAIKLVILILAKIFDSLKKNNKALNGTDKCIGLVIGLIKGFVIIAVICVIANLLQSVPAVANALDTVFNGSSIGKPIYEFVTNLASKYLYNIDVAALVSNIK